MPHKNSEHYGRFYIDFFIFCCIVLCFGTTLTWGFHNIFIVHGKGHGKHTNVVCTMVRLCGVKIPSQIFFAHGMCWKHGIVMTFFICTLKFAKFNDFFANFNEFSRILKCKMKNVITMKHGTYILWKKSRIQRWGVQYLIASTWWCSCPSTQMMISKHMGRRWWWRVLITYNLLSLKQDSFGLIIANSISKRSPFQIWHN